MEYCNHGLEDAASFQISVLVVFQNFAIHDVELDHCCACFR